MSEMWPGSLWAGRHPVVPGGRPEAVTVRLTGSCGAHAYFERAVRVGDQGGRGKIALSQAKPHVFVPARDSDTVARCGLGAKRLVRRFERLQRLDHVRVVTQDLSGRRPISGNLFGFNILGFTTDH